MVRIRLRRVGLKNQPSYRIIAADKEKQRDGRFLEILGFYNPRTEPSTIDVMEERIYYWLGQGAQPSDSVRQIFNQIGLMDRFEKYKSGEPVENLMAESKNFFATRNVNPKTNRIAEKKE